MIVPLATYTLKLLTTLDTVELGARYVAVDASGAQCYTFSRMSRRAIVRWLAPLGTVAGAQR